MSQQDNINKHASAANLYGTNVQKNTPDQRELEAHVLLKSARFLNDIKENWDKTTPEVLEETLKYNRQIWMMFYDTAIENAEGNRPNDLRSNIVNLANFVFKRELDILAKPEKQKLDILISINQDIAAGLMEKPNGTVQEAPQKTSSSNDDGNGNASGSADISA